MLALLPLGVHVHGQSDHTEVVLQEVLARGVVGLIGGESDGVAELAYELVRLVQGDVGKACHRRGGDGLAVLGEGGCHLVVVEADASLLPLGAHLWSDLHLVELHVVPEDDLWGFGEHRQVELLGIAVHAHVDAACIDPSAAVLARGNVVEVAHDVIAEVVLQVLG